MPLVQHKKDATASWVAAAGNATVAGAAQVRLLPSPFATVDAAAVRLPTVTDNSASPSASSGRFGRMRTLSAPERRTVEAARPQASPTKSGADGSPGEARLLSAQAAWAALGGSTSPQRCSVVNSPREAFQRCLQPLALWLPCYRACSCTGQCRHMKLPWTSMPTKICNMRVCCPAKSLS